MPSNEDHRLTRLLREPVLHFLLIGAALFWLYGRATDAESVDPDRRIVVSEGRIAQLQTVFARTWQRPPTPEELQGLIDDFVLEEIYYRRAVDMGIDRDDTIIRRRLRQKLEFLTDDVALLKEPTDEELKAFLAAHPDRFRQSPVYRFRQIYFNPDKQGDDPISTLSDRLQQLRDGEAVRGDTSLLPESFDEVTAEIVDATFGIGFAAELDHLTAEQWGGPIRSGLGYHLVLVDGRTEGRLPGLDEIRPVVQREWANDRRVANRQQMDDRLRSEYDVEIQWPAQNRGRADDDTSSNRGE